MSGYPGIIYVEGVTRLLAHLCLQLMIEDLSGKNLIESPTEIPSSDGYPGIIYVEGVTRLSFSSHIPSKVCGTRKEEI